MREMYQDALANPKVKTVLFTSGGTGAGKTSGLENIGAMRRLSDRGGIVYDTNMAAKKPAIEKIDDALKHKKEVAVVYTLADPVKSFDRVIGRAERMGRTVPLSEHVKTHAGSLESLKELYKRYKNNGMVRLYAIDNTGPKGSHKLIPVEKVMSLSYNGVDLLKTLRERLEYIYQTGRVGKEVYEGTSK